MEAYARLESEHSEGTTRRQFLQRVSSVEDNREDIDADHVSDRAHYLWEWFIEIKAAANNGMGNTITWTLIKDWAEIMCVNIQPWEARLVATMDNLFRTTSEKFKLKPKKEK